MPKPFSIKIFLPDGNPDGLRIIEKSNWTGQGIVFNRSIYQHVRNRPEFNKTGVYILIGYDMSSMLPVIYIGEGDPVKPRLESHYLKKDFWVWGMFFVSKDESLNKAHVKYIESRLIEIASKEKLCTLDNNQQSQQPSLSEAEKADAESFLEDMLNIFPLTGLTVFEATKRKPFNKNQLLKINAKDISAAGYETTNGFVVCKNSEALLKTARSAAKSIVTHRKDLVKKGILVEDNNKLVFTQDYTFSSPSLAAAVVLARSANGRIEWKNKNGKTLKTLQIEVLVRK